MADDVLNKIRKSIAARVRAGFTPREWIIEDQRGLLQFDYKRPDLENIVPEITDELLCAHRREQEQWIEPTDCDRLDQAFEGMERRGLVARQHFT